MAFVAPGGKKNCSKAILSANCFEEC